ncbi:MAG: SipW-dependent-type signal peptide-containing protein [Clostridiaceae bacterium]
MKKTKILLASLVASIMLVGAGFASWTDALNINNTVSTGNMKVNFDENYCKVINDNPLISVEMNFEGDVEQGENLAREISIETMNMYPGSEYKVRTRVVNTGTIPVKFDNAKVKFVYPDEQEFRSKSVALKKALVIPYLRAVVYDLDENGNKIQVYRSINIGQDIPLNELADSINTAMTGVELEEGQIVEFGEDIEDIEAGDFNKFVYRVEFPVGEIGQYQKAQNAELGFDITLNWKQFNAQ